MLDAILGSRIMLNSAGAFLAVVVSFLLFLGLRRMQRVGQPRKDKRIVSALPRRVHGPQELHTPTVEARSSVKVR